MPRRFNQGPALIDRCLDEFRQACWLAAQAQLAARNSRDIDEVVDQADKLIELLLHHPNELADLVGALWLGGDELDGRRQRGQRIAELMGQRREKLVLAAVRFPKRLLGSFALRNFRLQRFVELVQLGFTHDRLPRRFGAASSSLTRAGAGGAK